MRLPHTLLRIRPSIANALTREALALE